MIEEKTKALTDVSSKMAERMYAEQAQQQPGAEASQGASGAEQINPEEGVVDAEFEEVKEEDK